ncbi:type II toxin-antitoxin system VapC family toxin [Sphingomonas sanguinis]|uniref:Ribonuclease VapC n=1 Tax=Sphingomonas sanguinis TaxID=33051 RepID=A0ABU5LQE0_9SPHN|nr:type II toxin-antitoxin system VapC family toxin [Sphingomonas sanguinis]MDZ7282136.1 type II toxin-antitoxin system VapC family toxin [Sphingomonas sanguinis]
MILFVDASALVAILAEEPGWEAFERRIAEADILLWSAMSRYEAILGLRRSRGITLADAERDVDALATAFRFQMIAIGEIEGQAALNAHARYGKGHHPARLNMGDCFAYACAHSQSAELLYKGDDFALTDLADPERPR